MSNFRRASIWAVTACAVLGPSARADFEADLLKSFQKQNQQSARQVKVDVEASLARALALAPAEPEKALDILRKSQDLLRDDDKLAKVEREALASKVRVRLQDVRERLRSKEEAAKA